MTLPANRSSTAPRANTCPACQAHIGWRGLGSKAVPSNGGKAAKALRTCPHCGTALQIGKRSGRAAQFALGAVAWVCLMVAGVNGYSATGALAWVGYIGVALALAVQVLAPRWYGRAP